MSSSNIEERRKIVIPSKPLPRGKVRPSKEVDESDYRIAEEIYNLFSERARSGYDSYDDFVYHNFGSSGRLHRLWIREIGQAVPETILSLDELKSLLIECSDMVLNPHWFPLQIGRLTSLEDLGIYDDLRVLPDQISDLPNLKNLSVEGKSIIIIPRSFGFGSLDNLQTMHLTFHDESEAGRIILPTSIGRLKNLKEIFMWNVHESSLQCFDYFTSLEHLEMTGNFQTLPSSIGKMKNLKSLHLNQLSNSPLCTLPDEIGDLTNLEELKINLNIKVLPRSIANLKNLRNLLLMGAEISTLPDEIGKLMALECLDLRETPLRTLPSFVTGLKMLRRLHLDTEMLNEDSDVDVQGLIRALPRVGCIAYGVGYRSPQETPASIVQALMHNRGRTRFACSFKKDGEISIPLALWPFVLNRAKHLFRPYSRMKGDDYYAGDFECCCCRGKTQSDAIFQLLKRHGSTFVAKEHD